MTDIARRIPELDYFTWQQPVLDIKNDPPAGPSVGDRYLVGTGTGDWSGKDDNIAWYFDSSWNFTAPKDYMVVYDIDTGKLYKYETSSWSAIALDGTLTDDNFYGLIRYQSSAPSASDEVVYIDSDTNELKVYDAGTSSWVTLQGGDKTHLEQTPQELTDGVNISWDMDSGGYAYVTLEGNRTLDNPTNVVAGGTYKLRITQDATGSRTLTWGANFTFPGDVEPVLTSTANGVDELTFYAHSTTKLVCQNAVFDV